MNKEEICNFLTGNSGLAVGSWVSCASGVSGAAATYERIKVSLLPEKTRSYRRIQLDA
jgi:hypothetical protein